MADQNETQFYQAQYDAIDALFQTADVDANWQSLGTQVGEALSDPAMPRYHRARFHIINAWCIGGAEAELQLKWAQETLDDMVQVLHGSTEDEIDRIFKPLREFLEVTKAAFEKDKAELYVSLSVGRPGISLTVLQGNHSRHIQNPGRKEEEASSY